MIFYQVDTYSHQGASKLEDGKHCKTDASGILLKSCHSSFHYASVKPIQWVRILHVLVVYNIHTRANAKCW